MYYFAYIDADNICTNVYAMPSDLSSVPGYIPITESQYSTQSVLGKRWNAELSTWVEVVIYYYAIVDEDDICTSVMESDVENTSPTYIPIESLDESYIGKWFNRQTETWYDEVPFSVLADHSTDDINYRDQNTCLSDLLDQMPLTSEVYTKEQADAKFALIGNTGSGSGTPGADGEDGGYYIPAVSPDGVLSWVGSKPDMLPVISANIKGADGAAGQDGADGTTVVVGTVTTGEAGSAATVQGVLNEETNTLTLNFTIPQGAQGEQGEKGDAGDAASVDAYTRTETDNLLNGKADIGHGHDYAPTTHSHSTSDITGLTALLNGKSDTDHTHTGYAASNHTHSNYATSSHSHSNYFPTSGGTITGDTNFSGGLVRLKGVQTLYNSGTMITLSSNNVETMIAGKAIYSKVAISVSSDERVKENIAPVDAKACIDFINAIDVKTFNYKGNETPCVGVIAQQLEKLSPELAQRLVTKDADGMLGVKTSDLVFPLIVAVQSLSARVAELEK